MFYIIYSANVISMGNLKNININKRNKTPINHRNINQLKNKKYIY